MDMMDRGFKEECIGEVKEGGWGWHVPEISVLCFHYSTSLFVIHSPNLQLTRNFCKVRTVILKVFWCHCNFKHFSSTWPHLARVASKSLWLFSQAHCDKWSKRWKEIILFWAVFPSLCPYFSAFPPRCGLDLRKSAKEDSESFLSWPCEVLLWRAPSNDRCLGNKLSLSLCGTRFLLRAVEQS